MTNQKTIHNGGRYMYRKWKRISENNNVMYDFYELGGL